jgi:hypothetical protein
MDAEPNANLAVLIEGTLREKHGWKPSLDEYNDILEQSKVCPKIGPENDCE